MIRVTICLLAFLLLAPQAEAQSDEGAPWVRYVIKRQCYRHVDAWGAVSYPCYHRRVAVREYEPRVYGYERRYYDDRREPDLHPAPHYGPRCKERVVSAVGFEYANEDRALKSAQLIWASTVRQEHGEFYIDVTQARDVLTLCTPASVNDTVIGKLGEALIGENAILKRCRIWARPCRPEIERASFGKDREEAVRRNDPPARADYYEPEQRPRNWRERWRRWRGRD